MTYWLAPLILRLGTTFSATLAPWAWRASSANAWARYISGRSKDWLNFKNPNAPAVKREERAGREAGGPPNERTLAEGGVHAAPGAIEAVDPIAASLLLSHTGRYGH